MPGCRECGRLGSMSDTTTVQAAEDVPDRPALPDTKAVLALAMQAGEILLRSGAEISRVEETVGTLVHAFGLAASQCLVTPTGIDLCGDDPRLPLPVTLVRRVH